MTTPAADQPSGPLPGDVGWVDDGRLWTADELDRLAPDQLAVLEDRSKPKESGGL